MLKKMLLPLCFAIACSHSAHQAQITKHKIDKPLIQNLDSAQPQLQSLKHSLLRIHFTDEQQQESFGTAFFYTSKNLLVTSLHSFATEKVCLRLNACELIVGFASSAKTVREFKIAVTVSLKDAERDLIFLKVQPHAELKEAIPLNAHKKISSGKLVAAGFYQDEPALTFSHGKTIEKKTHHTLTSIIVSQGFSGSPVVNDLGEVVGVVSSFHPIVGHKIGLARIVNIN